MLGIVSIIEGCIPKHDHSSPIVVIKIDTFRYLSSGNRK
jgi:hypothetical protein